MCDGSRSRTALTPRLRAGATCSTARHGNGDEFLFGSANDLGQRRCGTRQIGRVVQSMRPPQRTRSGRAGTLVWCRDAGSCVARPVGVLGLRQPRYRHGVHRRAAIAEGLPPGLLTPASGRNRQRGRRCRRPVCACGRNRRDVRRAPSRRCRCGPSDRGADRGKTSACPG